MASLSMLDVCNRAIGRLPAAPIASTDEASLEARECRRYYPQVIADMLDGEHSFAFVTQRVKLAQLVTNDRATEWGYAYQAPSNLANPIRLLPDLSSLGIAIPVPIPGQPYAETWWPELSGISEPYAIAGQTIYSNASDATLEYSVSEFTGIPVPQLVLKAIELDLAARLAVPVKKDSAREKDLISQAEVAWQRAIADDKNRNPQSYGGYVSESLAARHGRL